MAMSGSDAIAGPLMTALPRSDSPPELRRAVTELVVHAGNSIATHKATNTRINALSNVVQELKDGLDELRGLVNQAVSVVTRMEQTRVAEQQATRRTLAMFLAGSVAAQLLLGAVAYVAWNAAHHDQPPELHAVHPIETPH